jgi:hypothetical protein
MMVLPLIPIHGLASGLYVWTLVPMGVGNGTTFCA